MKKAMGYLADVTMARTGEVITREAQKEMISKYAVANGIEIAGWFEDEACDETVMVRPGVQKLLASAAGCDTVLVERVWSLARNMPALEGLFGEMEKKGLKLEATSTLWDVTSQKCRHRFSQTLPVSTRLAPTAAAVAIRKPEKLNFAILEPVPLKVKS